MTPSVVTRASPSKRPWPASSTCGTFRRWREQGYRVDLFFLRLPDVETAISRVAARVRQGGHGIPDDVVRRRFVAGLRNFDRVYKSAVDAWAVYDNSGSTPILLQWSEPP